MAPARILQVHDAELGDGAATVDCTRTHKRVPLLLCESCCNCAHASRPSDPKAWVAICMYADES